MRRSNLVHCIELSSLAASPLNTECDQTGGLLQSTLHIASRLRLVLALTMAKLRSGQRCQILAKIESD